jgi:hypothetical protein
MLVIPRCTLFLTKTQRPCQLPRPTPLPLITQNKLTREEVDQRLVRALADLPERQAEAALVRYGKSVDSSVRSRQGFLVRMRGVCMRKGPTERLLGTVADLAGISHVNIHTDIHIYRLYIYMHTVVKLAGISHVNIHTDIHINIHT